MIFAAPSSGRSLLTTSSETNFASAAWASPAPAVSTAAEPPCASAALNAVGRMVATTLASAVRTVSSALPA